MYQTFVVSVLTEVNTFDDNDVFEKDLVASKVFDDLHDKQEDVQSYGVQEAIASRKLVDHAIKEAWSFL